MLRALQLGGGIIIGVGAQTLKLIEESSILFRMDLFHPTGERAIFLHNDLQCNDTCSVTGGA